MKIKKGFSTASGGEFFIDTKAIDARKNDTRKITNEKCLKVDMDMDELVRLFMQTEVEPNRKSKPRKKKRKKKSN